MRAFPVRSPFLAAVESWPWSGRSSGGRDAQAEILDLPHGQGASQWPGLGPKRGGTDWAFLRQVAPRFCGCTALAWSLRPNSVPHAARAAAGPLPMLCLPNVIFAGNNGGLEHSSALCNIADINVAAAAC